MFISGDFMSTIIHVYAHHFSPLRINKNNIDSDLEDFYCKEDTKTVLRNIVGKYHVSDYKSIGANFFNFFGYQRSDGGRSLILGLKISELDKNLIPINTVSNYNPAFVMDNFTKNHFDNILIYLVQKYFIDIEVLNNGSYISGSLPREMHVRPSKITHMGKQKAISYMDTRKKEPKIDKEQNLADLLVYGRAVTQDRFDEKTIITTANKIIKAIPKEFNPIFGPIRFP